jgi:hypothetical protein
MAKRRDVSSRQVLGHLLSDLEDIGAMASPARDDEPGYLPTVTLP